MGQIILASASPRRKELLEQIGISFEICPAKGEERITKSVPHEVVEELASQKAIEVASMVRTYEETHQELVTPSDLMVIGADTIVSCGGQILGKPKDEHDACRMLKLLSGGTHQVYTGVSIVLLDASGKAGQVTFHEKTDVTMRAMSEEEIRRYVATGEPMDKAGAYGVQGKGALLVERLDKAGAYGIQGKCAIFVDKIDGDYNNVVGLPVAAIYRELKKLGIDIYLW